MRLTKARGGKEMKETWEKPELVVLVRSKPEERVLYQCKAGVYAGPGTTDKRCQYHGLQIGGCGTPECETIGTS